MVVVNPCGDSMSAGPWSTNPRAGGGGALGAWYPQVPRAVGRVAGRHRLEQARSSRRSMTASSELKVHLEKWLEKATLSDPPTAAAGRRSRLSAAQVHTIAVASNGSVHDESTKSIKTLIVYFVGAVSVF